MSKVSLLKGDCLELLKTIPDKSVDMILCDPPYGTTQNKWDSIIPLDALWAEYLRICRGGASIVLFSSQPFTTRLISSNYDNYRYNWVWEKSSATGHLNAKKMPMKLHEDICVFVLDGGERIYNPQGLVIFGKTTRRGNNGTNFGKSGKENFQEYTNYPRSILRFSGEKKTVHPTQKPVDLLEYLISTYTNEGGVVVDNTMGSGSTGVAAVNLNRNFIGIELDEKYFSIAENRINDALAKKEQESKVVVLKELGKEEEVVTETASQGKEGAA